MNQWTYAKEGINMKSSNENQVYTPKEHIEAAASQLLKEGKRRLITFMKKEFIRQMMWKKALKSIPIIY